MKFKDIYENVLKEGVYGIFNSFLSNLLVELQDAGIDYKAYRDSIHFKINSNNIKMPEINGLFEFNNHVFFSLGRCNDIEETIKLRRYKYYTTNGFLIFCDLSGRMWEIRFYDKGNRNYDFK